MDLGAKRLKKSRLEAIAGLVLKSEGYEFETQFKFHDSRRWRSDFRVWRPCPNLGQSEKDAKVCLVEIEGVTHYGPNLGRHQTARGYEKDCEKYNAAALLGWTVFRFTGRMVGDGTMQQTLKEWFDES